MQDLTRIFRRVQNVIRLAKTTATTIEKGVIQRVQARFNPLEVGDRNSMQTYGFASALPVGSDVVVVNVSGDNSNGIIVASNHQGSRPKNMVTNEVRIYNLEGTVIQVKAGEVNITAATKVNITTPEVTMSGKLTVAGDVVSTGGDVKAATISLKQHVHQNTQPGNGLSGAPKP
ncbi:phage baseplate assembly protein domain-containing protein [Paracraurococcus lichenis]|uniref:Phage baseplate assembly protein n=1 Tax=Paracraurococcus lichenis TaxID=3064888 RepID=A0ABT9E4X2_9PROT|nr:phage baseplate assembly protein [Paracraurococcus sp. LOR1-02]MDO9711045.1 phage baseplate assembly protein [Paracraurococcus sp. LOR1-02]